MTNEGVMHLARLAQQELIDARQAEQKWEPANRVPDPTDNELLEAAIEATTTDLQARLDAAEAKNAELVAALEAAAAAFSMINADRYFRSAQTRARVEVDRINAALARTQGETP